VQVSKELSQLRPLAVMVENHPDSWPQAGLSQADIVYEALSEGGITRFLAIFQAQDVSSIGPVRSAREYYAEIADEWHALYAHVGGSNEVIAQLKNGKYKNLSDANEYFNFDYFPRNKGKVQPHHIFTSTSKLRDLISFYKYETKATFSPWQFQEAGELPTTTVKSIFIDFSRPGYEVTWEYNKETNEYSRLQYFQPHKDENTGKQIVVKNIVLQIVEVTPVPKDPLLSVDVDLNSGGKAVVFLNGVSVKGIWKKENGRTRFYDEFENEIKNKNQNEAEKEFGDVLFSLINYARFLKINPEDALEQTNKKFIHRFNYMEQKVKENGKQIADCKLEELDKYWNEAKLIK
jgi:hypothetical protein